MVVLRLSEDEVNGLLGSLNGLRQFTLTRPHRVIQGIATPCVCLIFGQRRGGRPGLQVGDALQPIAYMAVFKAKRAAATLDSVLVIRRGVAIEPRTEMELVTLLGQNRYAADLAQRLARDATAIPLGPRQSVELVEALLANEANRGSMRTVAGGLTKPRSGTTESLQYDALTLALRAFGLPTDAPAVEMSLARGDRNALARMNVVEDAVIEHDARTVPGYEFIGSDVRGRATFRNGQQTLEVYTANRRKLEEAFGVDLIYMNLFRRNAVLIQYKMLEPNRQEGEPTDWVYREDGHLAKQLRTMNAYRDTNRPRDGYRLNNEAFYFKFVRRRGPTPSTNVMLPLGHFEEILADPRYLTAGGRVRVNYTGLEGRYMRQTAFIDLLHAGYIGTDASTTEHLRVLIESVVSGDEALVVAVQRETHQREVESDRRRSLREWASKEDDD
ncbi:hypothetical protein SZ29_09140 [Burkholderia pseudomallei]|nr:hypothetical protein SZ29_09140 [Burkholderia pseudomallei]